MLMTAAGTVKAARVLVLGAGVAGLQAIATAKRLGAVIEASDVRPAVKEQIESLGAKFLDVPFITDEEREIAKGEGGYAKPMPADWMRRQAEAVHNRAVASDIVITTALIPGRAAPKLIRDTTVSQMKPGSVIVDLAAEQGGNVEGCEPGKETVRHGVTIIGFGNFSSMVPVHASQMFSRNVEKLLLHLTAEGAWKINLDEEITKGCVITREGDVVQAKVKEAVAKASGA
jgi:NAD(P) transhydrogenase subunit alpha